MINEAFSCFLPILIFRSPYHGYRENKNIALPMIPIMVSLYSIISNMRTTQYAGIGTFIFGLITWVSGSGMFWLPLIVFPALIFMELGFPVALVMFLMINPGIFIIIFFSLWTYVTFLYILAAILIIKKVFQWKKLDPSMIFQYILVSALVTMIITFIMKIQ